MEYELRPIHHSQNSFYKKAYVIEDDGIKSLRSYQTIVCFIEDGTLYLNGTYSNTTLRHIKEFIIQNGFESGTASELIKMYPSKKENSDEHLKGIMNSVKMVCAFGEILNKNESKENQNDFKTRMLKAGLGNSGLSMPNDWDNLSEEIKEDRLNKALEVIK